MHYKTGKINTGYHFRRYDVIVSKLDNGEVHPRTYTDNDIKERVDACKKVSKYGVISGLYFPVFGLKTTFYSVNCVFSANTEK